MEVKIYGIQVIWRYLTAHQLEELDKVKASFLKRALGLPRTARNRRVIAMAGCDGLIEDLVPRFKLSETPALELFRRNQAAKAASLSNS